MSAELAAQKAGVIMHLDEAVSEVETLPISDTGMSHQLLLMLRANVIAFLTGRDVVVLHESTNHRYDSQAAYVRHSIKALIAATETDCPEPVKPHLRKAVTAFNEIYPPK
jgi:hypothetical protein